VESVTGKAKVTTPEENNELVREGLNKQTNKQTSKQASTPNATTTNE
jgi:hypothetical protein